jgi:hypothetical protein
MAHMDMDHATMLAPGIENIPHQHPMTIAWDETLHRSQSCKEEHGVPVDLRSGPGSETRRSPAEGAQAVSGSCCSTRPRRLYHSDLASGAQNFPVRAVAFGQRTS